MSDDNVNLRFVMTRDNNQGTEEEREPLLENEDGVNVDEIGVNGPIDAVTRVAVITPTHGKTDTPAPLSKWSIVSVIILTVINLLNYMDRYTIAGVLNKVQDYYGISDTLTGLISTTFIISYMTLSPLFGFLGDRYHRKLIMAVGVFVWSSVTLASSFIPSNLFGVFLCLRALVGIGEASYSTIAPTIIADLFSGSRRTKALAVFYFAIPVGSGLGYIAGSYVAHAAGSWQWALRVTPVLGIVCSFLTIFLVQEPARGSSDHNTSLHATSYGADIRYLLTHKSFMLSSLGVTCVAFVSGALAFWAPSYITKSICVSNPLFKEDDISTRVSMIFGGITCAAGFTGVMLGPFISSKLKPYTGKADAFVCAFGLMSSAPFLYFSIFLSKYNEILTWVLIFAGETLLCLNWTVVADILLYLIIPTRRSSAEAVQILLSHLLGDAGSPFLVGLISDTIQSNFARNDLIGECIALERALYMTAFVCVLGGGFFLFCSLFVEKDRAEADRMQSDVTERRNQHITNEGSDDETLIIPNNTCISECV